MATGDQPDGRPQTQNSRRCRSGWPLPVAWSEVSAAKQPVARHQADKAEVPDERPELLRPEDLRHLALEMQGLTTPSNNIEVAFGVDGKWRI